MSNAASVNGPLSIIHISLEEEVCKKWSVSANRSGLLSNAISAAHRHLNI